VLLWFEAVSWHDELIASQPHNPHRISLSLAKYLPPSPPFCVLICRSHALSRAAAALSRAKRNKNHTPLLRKATSPRGGIFSVIECGRISRALWPPSALSLSLVLSGPACVCPSGSASERASLCVCSYVLARSLACSLACAAVGVGRRRVSIMFLDWSAKLGLLEHNTGTD